MNTRIWICGLIAIIFMVSCGDTPERNTTTLASEQEAFQSKQVQGHWTTDKNTAMELRAMQSTIENFNLLIKKQPQNLMAYQGYAATLKNHVNRTVTYCSLDKNARSLLCKSMDKISEQIEVIEKGDIKQAHDAAGNINRIFSEIDNSFNFSY
ncbi:hypothetical protein [uncultured Mucilaginibacter sp.]|uniref:hypothetical protein n=1 Tax=uncultured Mucilaginibacter sp. TaxID=797541 RepID=UPI0025D6996C|nr:hypothetical protein [uncultured Mucilaginibacter sp.]